MNRELPEYMSGLPLFNDKPLRIQTLIDEALSTYKGELRKSIKALFKEVEERENRVEVTDVINLLDN